MIQHPTRLIHLRQLSPHEYETEQAQKFLIFFDIADDGALEFDDEIGLNLIFFDKGIFDGW